MEKYKVCLQEVNTFTMTSPFQDLCEAPGDTKTLQAGSLPMNSPQSSCKSDRYAIDNENRLMGSEWKASLDGVVRMARTRKTLGNGIQQS